MKLNIESAKTLSQKLQVAFRREAIPGAVLQLHNLTTLENCKQYNKKSPNALLQFKFSGLQIEINSLFVANGIGNIR